MTDDTVGIVPSPGYIIVKPVENKEVQGFSISDQASEKDQAGIVLAVGYNLTTDFGATLKTTVVKGDTIVHKPYYTHPYKYEGMDLRFIRFQDVVGIYGE